MKRLSHFLLGIAYTVCALAGESRDIPFEHMLEGDHSRIGHAAIFYIRAGYEFEEFWALITHRTQSLHLCPTLTSKGIR